MKINNNNTLPTIEINSPKWYSILKIVFMISAFAVIAINVLSVSALPTNTTDWDFALKYCDCELVDDNDKEEDLEEQDEKEHEKESKEWNTEK